MTAPRPGRRAAASPTTTGLVDVVIPTVGRPSLQATLQGLALGSPLPGRIVVVDDRPQAGAPLDVRVPDALDGRVEVRRSGGRGPAAARNTGWRACTATWVAFLDDDVEVGPEWLTDLHADLAWAAADVAASQGRLEVPLPAGRRPTDWERNVAGLEHARWATADMAYRRRALAEVGGFDERFTRAYREDADLGLRVTRAGWRITTGTRCATHPVRPAPDGVSVALQAGNYEDPFMRALHGPTWRQDAGVPRGRRPWHLLTAAMAIAATVCAAGGRRRAAALPAAAWALLTADFARVRIAPGPRTAEEVWRMAWTSAVIPLAATSHWVRGVLAVPARLRRPGPTPDGRADGPGARATDAVPGVAPPPRPPPAAVLFDRDGTLVHDVPYNGDPEAVRPVDGARECLDRLRSAGVRIGVITNQSGVARGLIGHDDVAAVNARIDALLGPIDTWAICPHGPDDGCACRKPQPGLVHRAAAELGVPPEACVVIGDIGSDVEAAAAAGARGILVPTDVTLPEEVQAAAEVAPDLRTAVDAILGDAPAVVEVRA